MESSKASSSNEHATATCPISSKSKLQSSLHAATRVVHANLNKTITARLPLSLPPHSQDPTAYYLGMLVFGQIFVEFEREIDSVLKDISDQPDVLLKEEARLRHVRMIETQYTPGLSRTTSLRSDIEILRKRLGYTSNRHDVELLKSIEEKVEAAAEEHTKAIGEHIRRNPYLALAYTWTMYLALFNGGRWLHRQLANAGPVFWMEDRQTSSIGGETAFTNANEIAALSFWRFEAATQNDPNADRLKLTFKERFDKTSSLLTEKELEETVEEAKFIFELCLQLIDVLDDAMIEVQQAKASQEAQKQQAMKSFAISDIGVARSTVRMWQSLTSAVLVPAYQLLGRTRIWANPLEADAKNGE